MVRPREPVFEFGPFVLDASEERLSRDGTTVSLPPKTLGLLFVLVSRAGRLVDKDELLAAVWPGTVVEEGGLARNIFLLRRVLGDEPGQPRYIETVAKRGYRFVAPVRQRVDVADEGDGVRPAAVPNGSLADAEAPPRLDVRGSPASAETPRRWSRTAVAWARGLATLAALALIAWLVVVIWPFVRGEDRRRDGEGAGPTVAVLPLANLSGDPSQEFFADGLTEAVISELTKVRGLNVISRTSVMRYKTTTLSLPEVARALGADFVVEGSVRRQGRRALVTAQFIDGKTDRHVWSHTFDRDVADILELEQSVAADIARAVGTEPAVVATTVVAPHNVQPETYEKYLRARQHLERRGDIDLRAAAELFRQVTVADPSFALGHSGLAVTYFVLAGRSIVALADARGVIAAAANTAISLDPSLGEPHATLAAVSDDWEAQFDVAIRKQPGLSQVHAWQAEWLARRGRSQEAVAAAERAVVLDPRSPVVRAILGDILRQAGQTARAETVLLKVLAEDPTESSARWVLGMTYVQQRSFRAAAQELRRASSYSGRNAFVDALVGYALARAGQRQEAEAVLAALVSRSKGETVDPKCFVLLPWALGDAETAIRRVEDLVRARSEDALRVLNDPLYDEFRRDPVVAPRLAALTATANPE